VHEWDDQYGIARCFVNYGISHNVKRSLDGTESVEPEWVVQNVTVFDEVLPPDLDAKEFLRREREYYEGLALREGELSAADADVEDDGIELELKAGLVELSPAA